MTRQILDQSHVHLAIRDRIADQHADLLREVRDAIERNPVVVIGMKTNPFPRKARQLLDAKKLPYAYLEYGSYLSQWRRRNALKMWSGWPTLPMIFVKGTLIGGADDLAKLIDSGELDRLLA